MEGAGDGGKLGSRPEEDGTNRFDEVVGSTEVVEENSSLFVESMAEMSVAAELGKIGAEVVSGGSDTSVVSLGAPVVSSPAIGTVESANGIVGWVGKESVVDEGKDGVDAVVDAAVDASELASRLVEEEKASVSVGAALVGRADSSRREVVSRLEKV